MYTHQPRSPRTTAAKNTHFAIVAAGGTQGKPEKGDREYFIIAVHSGLYVAANGTLCTHVYVIET